MTVAWSEIEIGQELAELRDKPLAITDFVRYQGASGDMNPIHHDEAFARNAGFPTVFAVGMLGAGIAAGRVAEWLGPANVRRFKVQFREQAWPADELTYRAVVVGKREEDGERLVDLEFSVTRQTGGTHLRGSASFAVR